MMISLAVLLIPILILVWIYSSPGDETVEQVDVPPVLKVARAEAPYPVLAPVGLPEGWVPNRVRWAAEGEPWLNGEPSPANAWQVGYINPAGIYVALQQRDGSGVSFIVEVTQEGTAGDAEVIGDYVWTRYTAKEGATKSLVAEVGESTAIVAGDTSFEELAEFAATLTTS